MKLFNISKTKIISTLRFFARLLNLLLILVVALMAIGEGFPSLSKLTTNELLLTISLVIMLIGLLSAWKWELLGGILILVGFLAFFLVNSFSSGYLRLGYFFVLFPLTGVLFLICYKLEKG